MTGCIGEALHVAAQRAPGQLIIVDRPADIDPAGPTERTYAQWAAFVDEVAAWLWEAGVRPWDRVVVVKDNHFDVAILACAAARIGAVPALLSGAYGPEVAHRLLERLELPFVITDREHVIACGLDKDAVKRLTTRTICVDSVDGRPDLVPLDDIRGGAVVTPLLRAPEEPMVITHTSGTTGIPKLVLHSADSERSITLIEAERWPLCGIRSSDVWAYCEPYWHERHTHSMLAMATINQQMLMLSDPLSPRVKELLLKYRPTLVETLPNIYLAWEGLARDPGRPFANVREYINSFDAIHTRTIRTFLDATDRRMPIWLQAWSQSENGTLLIRPYLRRSVRRRGHRPPPSQSLGWPVPSLGKIRTVDPRTGAPVRRGEVGLIEISQPGRCLAYVDERHRHDLKRDGEWWNTGDLGVINRLGALRIVDREVDRIEGASAIELEDVLLDRLPQTTEIVILPVSGGLPVPVVSTTGDVPVDHDTWRTATADLPRLAEPIHIRWDEFPRTGTWKIRRVRLREELLPSADPVGTGTWT